MRIQRKPRLLIGSSEEALPVARALQENLDNDVESVIWDQNLLGVATVLSQELTKRIGNFDFAAFIFAPDDAVLHRGENKKKARDNVVFECGIASALLGLSRTFIVAPSDVPDLALPSNFDGLIWAPYVSKRSDDNWKAALGVASNRIRQRIKEVLAGIDPKVPILSRVSFFGDLVDLFPALLQKAKMIDLYFIHSRRWREEHDERIRDFLKRPRTKLTIYLPNPKNVVLMRALKSHFDDGPHIPGFVNDAIRYSKSLGKSFPKKVRLRYFNTYPTYSFYKFDDDIVLALYPTTPFRRSVPAFHVNVHHPFGAFVRDDLTELEKSSRKVLPSKTQKRK